jgi:hypothetical protein
MAWLIGPKVANFALLGTSVDQELVFGSEEFSLATGHTKLGGPLSLGFRIQNSGPSRGLYIGLRVEFEDGQVTTFDREAVAYCPPSTTLNITAASVPPLAHIVGVITKVIVILRPTQAEGSLVNVYLSADIAMPISSPPPLIGKDSMALNPGLYGSYDNDIVISGLPPGPGPYWPVWHSTIHLGSAAQRMRIRCISAWFDIPATATEGEIEVILGYDLIGIGVDPSWGLASEFIKYRSGENPRHFVFPFPQPFHINGTSMVRVVAQTNPSNYPRSVTVRSGLLYELVR